MSSGLPREDRRLFANIGDTCGLTRPIGKKDQWWRTLAAKQRVASEWGTYVLTSYPIEGLHSQPGCPKDVNQINRRRSESWLPGSNGLFIASLCFSVGSEMKNRGSSALTESNWRCDTAIRLHEIRLRHRELRHHNIFIGLELADSERQASTTK
jgi:hypothetical protein